MEAAREARIKFSIEKATFFMTKIKILGYSFDTKNIELTMDYDYEHVCLERKRVN